jgi:MerR HTH family regulatory protein
VTRRHPTQGYSLRDLQSLLGVSRRVLTGLIEAGFVRPARGRRNELRFTFQDVVLLRTAFRLQSARIPSRRILEALTRIKDEGPDERYQVCVFVSWATPSQ